MASLFWAWKIYISLNVHYSVPPFLEIGKFDPASRITDRHTTQISTFLSTAFIGDGSLWPGSYKRIPNKLDHFKTSSVLLQFFGARWKTRRTRHIFGGKQMEIVLVVAQFFSAGNKRKLWRTRLTLAPNIAVSNLLDTAEYWTDF